MRCCPYSCDTYGLATRKDDLSDSSCDACMPSGGTSAFIYTRATSDIVVRVITLASLFPALLSLPLYAFYSISTTKRRDSVTLVGAYFSANDVLNSTPVYP